MSSIGEKPYYYLHTMVDTNAAVFSSIMGQHGRERPPIKKLDVFLSASDETPDGVSRAMGFDVREVLCTISKSNPAVTYHKPYGLVLDGVMKSCFDGDTGKVLKSDGEYDDHLFDFTNETTADHILGEWYDDYELKNRFTWNEALLAKGARVVGAFHDPRIETMRQIGGTKEEYRQFIDKVGRCGLDLFQVTTKFGLF